MNKFENININEIKILMLECIRQMHLDKFKPNLIIGINSNSIILSILMSKYFGCEFFPIDLNNLFENELKLKFYSQNLYNNILKEKNILVILDENNIDYSYEKFNQFIKNIETSYYFNDIPISKFIKYASLIDYTFTKNNIDYCGGINSEKICLFFDNWWLNN